MSINPISSVKPVTPVESRPKAARTGDSAAADSENLDVYEKSARPGYVRDQAAIDGIRMQVEARVRTLRSTVQYLFSMQSARHDESAGLSIDQIIAKYQGNLKSFFEGLTVDPKTGAQAQRDIAEDGFWGVEQTSRRILDFARSLSGGDPEKAEEMRQAFLKGYQEAEEAWGGMLPDICRRTKDAVLRGFDEWSAEK